MIVKSVTIYVKIEHINGFIETTLKNRSHSIKEEGVVQFDVLQCNDDPSKFLLYEVYTSEEAVNSHLQTPHFKEWIDTVTHMFSGPRDRAFFIPLSPMEINK